MTEMNEIQGGPSRDEAYRSLHDSLCTFVAALVTLKGLNGCDVSESDMDAIRGVVEASLKFERAERVAAHAGVSMEDIAEIEQRLQKLETT